MYKLNKNNVSYDKWWKICSSCIINFIHISVWLFGWGQPPHLWLAQVSSQLSQALHTTNQLHAAESFTTPEIPPPHFLKPKGSLLCLLLDTIPNQTNPAHNSHLWHFTVQSCRSRPMFHRGVLLPSSHNPYHFLPCQYYPPIYEYFILTVSSL
jgi:hypothetical protein